MHPILLKIGSFELPTFGPILALALGAAVYVSTRLAKRDGLDPSLELDLSIWMIIVAIVGAKVMMVFTDLGHYIQHPGDLFSWSMVQAAGVFYGGFLAAWFFGLGYTRLHNMPVWKVADTYGPAIAIGQAVGRWGCFMAGDDYGKPTTSSWHVVFTNPDAQRVGGAPLGVPLYPVQLYESAATLAIFGFLLWKYRHKRYDGQIFLWYMGLYAVARFFLEFLRGDEDRGFVFHHLLSTSQFIAIPALGAAVAIAALLRKRSPRIEAVSQAIAAARRSQG